MIDLKTPEVQSGRLAEYCGLRAGKPQVFVTRQELGDSFSQHTKMVLFLGSLLRKNFLHSHPLGELGNVQRPRGQGIVVRCDLPPW